MRCGSRRLACHAEARGDNARRRALGARDAERKLRATGVTFALSLLLTSVALQSEPLALVHQQRYAMGTMFDIIVYHASRADAERAVGKAMEEIVRLDQVLSHFKADSELSKLNGEGRRGFVAVEPSLYEVIQEALAVSRHSGGKFDVTIAPLLRLWKRAREEKRSPSTAEISSAQRCVGYEKIELNAPDRIRFRSNCLEIDLGGIGKGYAVDRALGILKAAGIRHAVINAGSSSIGSIGAPPEQKGWQVTLGASAAANGTLLLQDRSMSTSQQDGEILDPQTGAPAASPLVVSVVGPSGAVADALSTTLLILSVEDGISLLARFSGVAAIWLTPAGELKGAYGNPPWGQNVKVPYGHS